MSKALAAYRKARAVELALADKDYDSIAAELGYANRGTTYNTVQRALKARTDQAVDQYRAMELQRLDALQQQVWDGATASEVGAARSALKISGQRCRLLGTGWPRPDVRPRDM